MTTTVPVQFHHIMLPAKNEKGEHILSVIAKRSYRIIPFDICTATEEQRGLIAGDTFFDNGNALTTSCKFESDYVPWKTATDVVFNGSAYAPANKPVDELPVRLTVGNHEKSIIIIGDRYCTHRMILDPVFSDPQPFSTKKIRYENAYGGVDAQSFESRQYIYPRNPVGKGFVIKNKKNSIDNLLLPNLEDPEDKITPARLVVDQMKYWPEHPLPQSFGWYGKSWFPRSTFAGIMPDDFDFSEEMEEILSGQVPNKHLEAFSKLKMKLMDFRYFNGASPDLTVPFLNGNESIHLLHCDPDYPELSFVLPGEKPVITIDTGDGPEELDVKLFTVMIEKNKNMVSQTWCGALPYDAPDAFCRFTDLTIEVGPCAIVDDNKLSQKGRGYKSVFFHQ